jgi:NitT/TauT family transport system substrate-binding protein
MTTINIMALRHSAFYSPFLMTMAGGYLRDAGLDYTYQLATPDLTIEKQIADGKCHLAQSAVATSFAALESGTHSTLRHFAQINERDGFYIVSREKNSNFQWHDLIGKKVLVDHFFQPYAMLNFGLKQREIDITQINVIDAGNVQELETAFRNGVADFAHMQGPVPQQLEADGIGYVVAAVGDLLGPVAFSSLVADSAWLQTEMASTFILAYKKARAFVIAASADEIAQQMFQAGFFPDIDQQVLINTVQAYKDLGCWTDDINISEDAYNTLLDVFVYNGLIKQRFPYQSVIASSSG